MKKFIEATLLKSYSYSNLNRDAGNSPKNCVFGGVQRARVSSQCLKRNFRLLFNSYMNSESTREALDSIGLTSLCTEGGIRTRRINSVVLDYIKGNTEKYGSDMEKYYDMIENAACFSQLGKSKKNKGKDEEEVVSDKAGNTTIQFYSLTDIETMADLCVAELKENKNLKKLDLEELLKKANNRQISLDMALFGRMSPTTSFTEVDGTMQVAHSFSTNKLHVEDDFFTAVDDYRGKEDDAGSAHLNDAEFTAPCLYQYFNLDIDAFCGYFNDYIDGEEQKLAFAKLVVENWVKSLVLMHPTGKQNSTASMPLPYMLMVSLKDVKLPSTYENAFINPVTTNFLESSTEKFVDCVNNSSKMTFINDSKYFLSQGKEEAPVGAKNCSSACELLDSVLSSI